ncbi:NAD(P)/FAD-dependent oxidoreductase [Nocardia sp. NPDC019395]|uniref:flavin-containing monooxygenase n=1 Tax=Nocardia sp. NPDC019395 TaxID=3154686 RepID=UPI0033E09B56
MAALFDSRQVVDPARENRLDAVIVGAGMAGVRQLVELHRRGLEVLLIERGSGVGGTWHFNRYPGARTDSDAYSYGFFFDPEIAQKWTWKEHFASQEDLERYYNWIIDRFCSRDEVLLNTTVEAAHFDDASGSWTVTTDTGRTLTARYLILATGMTSHPIFPPLEGKDDFHGPLVHTGLWPEEGLDLAGKRIAQIGTGSSGIQIAPFLAKEAAQLTVYQRRGHWSTPLNNRPLTDKENDDFRARFAEYFKDRQVNLAAQAFHEWETRTAPEVSEKERRQKFDYLYDEVMGLRILAENFTDAMSDGEANRMWSDYLAERIRGRVHDPAVAERLIPKDHGFGRFRPPKDTGYYEIFNEEHVDLVSMTETPVVRITRAGIETTEGEREFDIIVCATGFEVWLGALRQIDIRGLNGRSLQDAWSAGPHTVLGVATPGFPNMFFNAGAHGVGSNSPAFVEYQAPWIADIMEHTESTGARWIDCTAEAADAWTEHVYEAAAASGPAHEGAWYVGGNVANGVGKMLVYMGGIAQYSTMAADILDHSYRGFVFAGSVAANPSRTAHQVTGSE